MHLRTPLYDLLGIRAPILNAPMTPYAGGELAGSVSAAGGLGMLGLDETATPKEIEEETELARARSANFGIGLVSWVLERRPDLLDLALAARPRLVSISFGDPSPYVERVHAAGALLASQVQNRASAQQALDAGVDILVAQGTEAGGHTGTVGTLPLLQLILEMTRRPVIAAGGIHNGRGFAAALAAGASGIWVGTPFLLASESRTPEAARRRLIESDETQTIYTSVYDRIKHTGWTSAHRGRALQNAFTARWHGHEEQMLDDPTAEATFKEAKESGDFTVAHLYAGQSVGSMDRVRPAREIVESFESDCIRRLREVAEVLRAGDD